MDEKGRLCLNVRKDEKIVFTNHETGEVLMEITLNKKCPYTYTRLVFYASKKLVISREKL